MHKKSILNKTNFANELGRNLALIPLKFVDIIQWFLQDNYGKEYYDIPISYFNGIVGSGENTCSNAQITKFIGVLLTTKISLFSAKYLGKEVCTYISYFKIFRGFIRIKVDSDLQNRYNINHANNKSDGYNPVNLSIVKNIKNKYAYRFYPHFLAKKNQSKGKNLFTVNVLELRKLVGCENSYKNFNEFNRSVLKPAIEEINSKTDLYIEFSKDEKSPVFIDFLVKKQELSTISKSVIKQEQLTPDTAIKPVIIEPKPKIEPVQEACTATTKHLPELVQELLKAGFDDDTELMRHWNGGEFGKCLIGEVYKAIKSYQDKGKPTSQRLIAWLLKDEKIKAKVQAKLENNKPKSYLDDRDAKAPCTVVVDSKELVQAKKEACEQNNRIFTKIWEETSEKNKVSILESIAKSDIQVFKHGALNIINSKDFSRKNIKENIWGLVMLQLQNIHNIPIIIPKEAPALAPASYDRSKIEDREAFLRLKDGMNEYFKGFDEMIKNSTYAKEFYA